MSLELKDLRPIQAMAAAMLFRERKLMLNLPRQYGGKTELGIRIAHDLTRRPSPSSCLYVAKNSKARRKAAREKFLRIFDRKMFAVNTELVYLKSFKTSQIQMGSVDVDPDADRGGTHNYLHWSEVAFARIQNGMSISDVWQKIYRPMLSQPNGYALLESTNNGHNGWKELWDNAKELGFATLRVPFSRMLELGLVSQEEYDREKNETHPLIFDQEYECEWVTFQGRAYGELHDGHFCDVPGPEPWQNVIAAIDWGYDPSATCILFGYVRQGCLFVFDEIYATKQLIEQSAEAIKAVMARWGIEKLALVADHEEDRNQELINRGLGVTKADKVDVLGNRLQIKKMLWKNEMYVDRTRCPFTRKDLQAAVWHPKREGDLDDTQCTWGHWDAEAALRYLVRAFAEYEADEPEINPHITTDEGAARDWMMRREHQGEQ
jgi:hypothetical protein